jgi:hypothetical protein
MGVIKLHLARVLLLSKCTVNNTVLDRVLRAEDGTTQ